MTVRTYTGFVWLATALAMIATLTVGMSPAARALDDVRWSGSDRYATSVRISQQAFPEGTDTVFVATGSAFPDALAAGPLAGMLDAPILLTESATLPAAVSRELQRLQPETVVVLGGAAAVTADVEQRIGALTAADMVRISGDDRYATAAAVVAYGFGAADAVYLASGAGFADALSAASPGGIQSRPILLTTPDQLPAPTAEQIERLGDSEVIVLGGSHAVSEDVLDAVEGLTDGAVRRLSGEDRYATGAAVSADAFPSASTAFLATGSDFPDALGAAPAAAGRGAPILLASEGCVTEEVAEEIARLGVERVVVVGGTNAVSDAAARLNACDAPPPDPFTFTGQGDDVVDVRKPEPNAPAVVEVQIDSTSNAAVWSLDADLERTDLLVNEIGDYRGTVLLDVFTLEPARYLDVTATGSWSIRVRSLDAALDFDRGASGSGDSVLQYVGPARTMRLTHDGDSNFAIWHHRDLTSEFPDSELVVNEIGGYDGRQAFPAGPAIIEVQADGDWAIAP
jgi:putative cell wall-binding protein